MVQKIYMTAWEMVCWLLMTEYMVEGVVKLKQGESTILSKTADQFSFGLQKPSSYSEPVEAFA